MIGGTCLCGLAIHAEDSARKRTWRVTTALVNRHCTLHACHSDTVLTDLQAVLHPQRLELLHGRDAVLTDDERTQMRLGYAVVHSGLFSETLLLVPGPDGCVLGVRSQAPPIRLALVSGYAWCVGLVLVLFLWLRSRRTALLAPGPQPGQAGGIQGSESSIFSVVGDFALAVKDKVRTVRNLLDSLAEEPLQPPALHHLGQARQTLKEFDALLQDMRRLNTPPIAALTGAFEPAFVNAYLDEILAQAMTEGAAQAVFLSSAIRLSVNECRFDPELTSDVILRLLDNAKRHCHSRVSLSVITLNPHSVSIAVHDDGPGIPSDQWVSMLQPLSRADASRGRSTGRYGLGLAICKALIECQGASIRLRTSPLGGACVELIFIGIAPP
ncbi:sensor histidine kinase [Pseudomonas sp. 22-AL-CL-001]|uniref:sensor histidine kinase n=1 Tax=Pseudomonas alabamensis TaxID=3064349 RepID=UPI002712CDF6|nr:sensor histidine kinase [Pseudomonas sp. 22-AL-CL-001]MDO7911199.1 sensor histidine kinase [Pseudomonas sp. 22-AL-CL-001]